MAGSPDKKRGIPQPIINAAILLPLLGTLIFGLINSNNLSGSSPAAATGPKSSTPLDDTGWGPCIPESNPAVFRTSIIAARAAGHDIGEVYDGSDGKHGNTIKFRLLNALHQLKFSWSGIMNNPPGVQAVDCVQAELYDP